MRVALIATGPLLAAAAAGQSPAQFKDVSSTAGIGPYRMASGMGGGVSAADYDNDGDIDLFVPNAEGWPDQLYRNDGQPGGQVTFVEIASEVGLASIERSRVALWIDVDGDGRLDLLVANDHEAGSGPYRLYRQDEGTFTDVTEAAGLSMPYPARFDAPVAPHRGGLCAGDVDGDGFLDVFSAQWNGRPHLLVNNGDGSFHDGTARAGVGSYLPSFPYAHQPVMADFDGDGWTDIYVAIDFLWNVLWINQGDGTFVDVAPGAGADNAMNDMGTSLGDFDNDGDFDLYVTNITSPGQHNILLVNETIDGSCAFVESANAWSVAEGGWGWGATFLDFDNDGWLDIAATNGWGTPMFLHDRSRLYRNRLGAAEADADVVPFEDVSAAARFDDPEWGSALIAFDADRDGDLDLAQTCSPSPLRLLENRLDVPASAHGHLVVRPRMGGGNRFAIGAVVRVSAGRLSMSRPILAGTSYLGQEPAEAHFGLGAAVVADSITIEWPDGSTTCLTDVPTGAIVEVMRPEGPPGDLDGDGRVTSPDLLALIDAWGVCPGWPLACPADLDGDCHVGPGDLLELLLGWD